MNNYCLFCHSKECNDEESLFLLKVFFRWVKADGKFELVQNLLKWVGIKNIDYLTAVLYGIGDGIVGAALFAVEICQNVAASVDHIAVALPENPL